MASISQQTVEDFFQQLLAEMSPADEQYMMQLLAENAPAAGPIREVVQNILDERLPLEEQERLPKPLLPQSLQPTAPPRQRRGRRRQELLGKFDPFPPENTRRVTNYQDDLQNLFNVTEHEGKEERGRRFIRWRFIRGLERDLTPNSMANTRESSHIFLRQTHLFISATQH